MDAGSFARRLPALCPSHYSKISWSARDAGCVRSDQPVGLSGCCRRGRTVGRQGSMTQGSSRGRGGPLTKYLCFPACFCSFPRVPSLSAAGTRTAPADPSPVGWDLTARPSARCLVGLRARTRVCAVLGDPLIKGAMEGESPGRHSLVTFPLLAPQIPQERPPTSQGLRARVGNKEASASAAEGEGDGSGGERGLVFSCYLVPCCLTLGSSQDRGGTGCNGDCKTSFL